MNLAKALVAPKKAALARERETKKAMSPSQPLGGGYIPPGNRTTAPVGAIDPNTLVLKGWKANEFAYTCVKRLASAAAQAYWRIEERTGPGPNDWQPRANDWRNEKLNYPTGETLSAYEVYFYWGAWLAINGNGLLRVVPGGENGILEIWPMSPKNVQPVLDKEEWISGYNIIEDGQIKQNYPKEEIIHCRLPDPSNPTWGFGMLEAAWRSIQAASAQADWRQNLSENGGVPPAAITDDGLSPFTLDEATAALHAAWRRNAKDGVPMLLGPGKEVLQLGFSPADMMIPEDRELTRDQIIAAFGMHPSQFSNEAATFDNQDSGTQFMYENGAGEILAIQREALNLKFLTRDERESDSVYVNFDLSQIPFFRRQRQARIAGMGVALKSGVSRNDYVDMADLGLEKVEGGDAVFIESGLTLLSEAAEGRKSEPDAKFNFLPAGQPKPDPDPGEMVDPASSDLFDNSDKTFVLKYNENHDPNTGEFSEGGGGGSGAESRSVASAEEEPSESVGSKERLKEIIRDQKDRELYVRWSRGHKLDKKQGDSRDFQSGQSHVGLSSVRIDPSWADDDGRLSRRLTEYSFLRMKDPKISAHIYSGKRVGTDSDGYDLISDIKHVASPNRKLLSQLLDESKT